LSSCDEKAASEQCLRFEEFDALAECRNDLAEDAHVVACRLVAYGGEGAMGVGLGTE
jgi:hypothetical protein